MRLQPGRLEWSVSVSCWSTDNRDVSISSAIACVLILTLAAAHSRAALDDRRITNVSDVGLRSAPSVNHGWVQGSLTTTPLDPGRRDQTIESIVVSRLQSGGNFAARVELFELVERTMARLADSEARARFALYRLRAMSSVFESIPIGEAPAIPLQGGFVTIKMLPGTTNLGGGGWSILGPPWRCTKDTEELPLPTILPGSLS